MSFRDLVPWWRGAEVGKSGLAAPYGWNGDIDRLFDDFTRSMFAAPAAGRGQGPLMPKMDIAETAKAYEVAVELPGIDPKDVELSVADDVLTIKGESRTETTKEEKNYLRVERSQGSFQRALSLPADADQSKIEATFDRGMLKVSIAKAAPAQSAARKINVKAG